jgi:dTDP-4-amino-4,6-dideoxygalactose transaminase
MADTVLSLPLWPGMKKEEVEHVADAIRSFYKSV